MGCIYFKTTVNDFVSKLVVMQNIFPLLSKGLWSKINSSYSIYYFQIWNKK